MSNPQPVHEDQHQEDVLFRNANIGAMTAYKVIEVDEFLNAKTAETSEPHVDRRVQLSTPTADVSEILNSCLSGLNTQLEKCRFIIEGSVKSSFTLSMQIDGGLTVNVCEIIYEETSRDSDVGEGATEIPTKATLDFVPFTSNLLSGLKQGNAEMDKLYSQSVYSIAGSIASLVSQSINGPTMEG